MKEWFHNLSKPMKTAVIIAAFIVLFLIYRQVKFYLEKPKINKNNIPVTGVGPGNEVVQWDPDPLAKEISENLEGYNFTTYPETAQKVLDLQTDDQVKLLYNYYNEHYAKDYPTLTQLFSHEWDDWSGKYAKVVTRLEGLGLK